jgi:predicted aconitase with swiveling domain
MEITLRGQKACRGKAEGEALVCHQPLALLLISWVVDQTTGVINLPSDELHGKSIKDKILVYPSGCGGVGYFLYLLKKAGIGPKAIVNMQPYTQDTIDAIFSRVPMVYGFDSNLLEIIETGDHVDVDANNGIITVIKASY